MLNSYTLDKQARDMHMQGAGYSRTSYKVLCSTWFHTC